MSGDCGDILALQRLRGLQGPCSTLHHSSLPVSPPLHMFCGVLQGHSPAYSLLSTLLLLRGLFHMLTGVFWIPLNPHGGFYLVYRGRTGDSLCVSNTLPYPLTPQRLISNPPSLHSQTPVSQPNHSLVLMGENLYVRPTLLYPSGLQQHFPRPLPL